MDSGERRRPRITWRSREPQTPREKHTDQYFLRHNSLIRPAHARARYFQATTMGTKALMRIMRTNKFAATARPKHVSPPRVRVLSVSRQVYKLPNPSKSARAETTPPPEAEGAISCLKTNRQTQQNSAKPRKPSNRPTWVTPDNCSGLFTIALTSFISPSPPSGTSSSKTHYRLSADSLRPRDARHLSDG